ncbi:MAG: bifunctional riboflavin kinase/FAD synthetase [Pseudomonadota bacterium]|nr:bifunctional riboflavin kinase/FAD synthetase [Pseudomonadota bacterium]
MQFIRGLNNLQPLRGGCVATIGNYDGVHRGHQTVLAHLGQHGDALGLPTVVVTFEPSPQEFFVPADSPPRLTRLREKLSLLRACGVDYVLCLRFNKRLASMSPADFVHDLLVEGLGVRYLVVGDDFRFGQGRRGDFHFLQTCGLESGFAVEHMPTFAVEGERVSSSRIRAALAEGDLDMAERLLGRPYSLCGRVIHGDKVGRTIGFPTANISLRRRASPLRGIYVVTINGLEDGIAPGVASIGTRPTVNGTRELLEVHLLGQNRDLYGQFLEVTFLKRLRDEERFSSVEAMRRQIEQDAHAARDHLGRLGFSTGALTGAN